MENDYEEIGMCQGYPVFRRKNEVGAYTYVSGELGQTIWDTAIVSEATLLFVLNAEKDRAFKERLEKDK